MADYAKHNYKPLFNRRRDVKLFNRISDELLNRIIQITVVAYKISTETESNLYGESMKKVYTTGIQLGCLLTADEQVTDSTEGFGPLVDRNITMAFHREMLASYGYYPETGDIIEWDESYYEIYQVVENQLIGGDSYKNYSIVASATMISRDKLNLEQLRVGTNE